MENNSDEIINYSEKHMHRIVAAVQKFRIKNIRKILSLMRRNIDAEQNKNMFLTEYGMSTYDFSTAYVLTKQ